MIFCIYKRRGIAPWTLRNKVVLLQYQVPCEYHMSLGGSLRLSVPLATVLMWQYLMPCQHKYFAQTSIHMPYSHSPSNLSPLLQETSPWCTFYFLCGMTWKRRIRMENSGLHGHITGYEYTLKIEVRLKCAVILLKFISYHATLSIFFMNCR